MTREAQAAGPDHPDGLRADLLSSLGLSAQATPDEIEAAHAALTEYLAQAPTGLQTWADHRRVEIDSAYERLTADPATTPVLGDDDELDESAYAHGAPSREVPAGAAPAATAAKASRPAAPAKRRSPWMVMAAVVLVAGVVYGVWRMGMPADAENPTAAGSPTATAQAMPTNQPVDPAERDQLIEKVEANPRDVASLRRLGEMHFLAGDYESAASWQQKIVDVDPKDVNARLALGVAKFNTGDIATAETQWNEVLEIDPKNAEAHYDLGFLHMSKNPPDIDKVEQEWAKVVELAPGSDLAKSVEAHLGGLRNPAPGTTTPPGHPNINPTSEN